MFHMIQCVHKTKRKAINPKKIMEKEGIIMKEEERKTKKEELKENINELTEEELDNVAGGKSIKEVLSAIDKKLRDMNNNQIHKNN